MQTIQLTTEDAARFVQFNKHYALIGLLESISAFDLRNANVVMHFNDFGEIKTIEKHEYYRV